MNGKDFTDVVNDVKLGKLSWIIRVGPQYNHMCPYETKGEGDLTTHRRGKGNVAIEPETETIWTKSKEHFQVLKIGKERSKSLLELPESE